MNPIHSESKRLPGIQLLRALASNMVLIFHVYAISHFDRFSQVGSINQLNLFSNYWAGVDLFFCISGFIIFNSYSRKKLEIVKFLKGRIVRIIPTYYLVSLITIFVYVYDNNLKKISATYLIQSFLLIVNLEIRNPVLAVGWSLQFEFLFYALFCVVYMKKRKANLLIFSFGALLVTFLPGIGFLFTEFLLGAAVSILTEKISWNPKRLIALIFLTLLGIIVELSCVSSLSLHNYRVLLLGAPFAFLVFLCSKMRKVNSHIVRLGDASYSLYLTHTFTMTLMFQLLGAIKFILNLELIILILVICNIFSLFFWKYIEKNITDYFKCK